MTISTRIWAGLGLSLLCGPVFAQQPSATNPWSIGLRAAVQRYAVTYSFTGQNELTILPVEVVAGYQLTPRLGLQTGLAYRKSSGQDQLLSNPDGTVETNSPGFKSFSVPLLARYSLSRQPGNRLQLQVIGGATVLHSSRTVTQRLVSTGQTYSRPDKLTQTQLSVGAGLTKRLSPHWSGAAEMLLNRPTRGHINQSSWLAYYSVGLGFNYHFG
ncbi:outer membrane beta-barrel protein [Hymenobacter pini]|uniref:outer membrane beta-barrel protein n=1 Tax=Hymenobacter pini TaxID=2880879 RepID=UPI001CF41FED|nr:outer membrane beta-barrel protein [Hymenobacter pini]MCA8832166.1 PorT family protein [Hymenobacter pini]